MGFKGVADINILYYTLMNVIRTFVIQKVFLLVFTIFIFMQNNGQNETQVKLIIVTY